MRRFWIGVFGVTLVSAGACVLGEPQEPGCAEDAECGDGFVCRGGACFEETFEGPVVSVDAGADADASD